MERIPEPDSSPAGPRYQGRLLDRPDEEVVDQGIAFDVATLMSRRVVLGLVGAGVGGAALAACSSPATTTTSSGGSTSSDTSQTSSAGGSTSSGTAADLPDAEIPDETAGPYPADGSNGPDVLESSGIVRSDLRTSLEGGGTAEGVPLSFSFTLTDMANGDAPLAGAAVYAWHCDGVGRYSMYSAGVEDQDWLRGVQVADDSGVVTFTSIFPGCYAGRWPHIHFEVYSDLDATSDAANAIATSQAALPEAACQAVYAMDGYDGSTQNLAGITLETDNVFGDDGAALQMATLSGDPDTGYIASLSVRIDTTTEPASGGSPGGGGAPGGGGPRG